MRTHYCEECWAVLDLTKVLRCTKCKACFYCSAACQKQNWRIHKRVCTTEPLLRRFVPVEMAIERAVARQPKTKAPKDAFCYICLEGDGDGKSSKLMRGCACRGDSAGFVHLECLTELAKSKEASGDLQTVFDAWNKCGNCKQKFTDTLELEMLRRFWRCHRSQGLRYNATITLANCLGFHGEVDTANKLLDEASTFVGNNNEALLELKLLKADMLARNGQMLEALGILQAMLPEAKAYKYTVNPSLYSGTLHEIVDALLGLDRYQEAHEMATEHVAFAKAKFGPEDNRTLDAMTMYATTCAMLGSMEESKANFKYVLTTQTRILGRDHPDTQACRRRICSLGFAERSESV